MRSLFLSIHPFSYNICPSFLLSAGRTQTLEVCWCEKSVLQVKPTPLTIVAVCQDGDLGGREVGAHLAAHGHAEADVEALFLLIQRVINDDDATEFLSLVLVKAQHAGVVLRSGDVVRVGQHSAGYGASGRG